MIRKIARIQARTGSWDNSYVWSSWGGTLAKGPGVPFFEGWGSGPAFSKVWAHRHLWSDYGVALWPSPRRRR